MKQETDNSNNQKVTQDPDVYTEVQNPNWQDNIQYFFRERDVACMKPRNLHLDQYTFVKDHVNQILNRVKGEDGNRMPAGGPIWANARINTLNNWKKNGKPNAPSQAPQVLKAALVTPQVSRTRRNINDPDLDMVLVAKAFQGLMDRPPAGQDAPPEKISYYDLAAFHGHPWGYCTHHSNSYNPWHRLYNIKFENAMRTVSGCENVTLPYWDIQESITDGKIPAVLSQPPFNQYTIPPSVVSDLKIKKRTGESKSIIEGSKGYTTSRFPDSEILSRLEASNVSGSIDQARHAKVWEEFNGNTTNGSWTSGPIIDAHDNGHDSSGKTMQHQSLAAYDPIFWFFHCNWDRLWWEWQLDNHATDVDSFLLKVGDNKDWLSKDPDVGYELDPFEVYCWQTIDLHHYKINNKETGVNFAPSSTTGLIAANAPERFQKESIHGDVSFSFPKSPMVMVKLNHVDRMDIPGTFKVNLKSGGKIIKSKAFFQNHKPVTCANCAKKPLVNFIFEVPQKELVGDLSFEIHIVATDELIPLSEAGDPTIDVSLMVKT